jgi:hypothetical protein
LDVTPFKEHLIDFAYLEAHYEDWLRESVRDNTMNEYGFLLDLIGFGRKGFLRQHQLLVACFREG